MMRSAFIRELEKQLPPTVSKPKTTPLEMRLQAWLATLPEFTRLRPFSMGELELALNTQGRHISPVLIALGWVRKRKWDSKQHYHRYWVPPG
jgi:hypothetical protein